MRKAILLLNLLTISLIALGKPVSAEQAKKKAESFVAAKWKQTTLKPLNIAYIAKPIDKEHESKGNKTKGKTTDKLTPYYIYNVGKDNGFVIVAGDDRAGDIIGYSNSSASFDVNNIPDNMRAFLNIYDEEIAWIVSNADETYDNSPRRLPAERIEPLCTSQWSQDNPYNLYTPTVNGSKTPTGCVATAMAQVMYHHRWPQTSTEAVDGYQTYGGQSYEDLPSITFDWDNMTDTYSKTSSQASNEAVAKLMQYCGWIVQMNYAPNGSGAYTTWLPGLMKYYFHYGSGAKTVNRDDYSIDEWAMLMFSELKADRPVIYTGYTSKFEGHAFVCDGYDGDGLFHINWGWGGSHDGFFRLSLLNAGGTGIGGSTTSYAFSVGQQAVIGLCADGVEELPVKEGKLVADRAKLVHTTYTRTSANSNFSNVMVMVPMSYNTADYENFEYSEENFTVGMGLYEGSTLMSVYDTFTQSFHTTSQRTTTFNFSFGNNISDGLYRLVPMCKLSNSATWEPMINANLNYVEALVNGNNLTLTVVPKADFKVTNARFDGRKYYKIDLVNPHEEFNGVIYMYDLDGNMMGFEQVAIPAESNDHVDIYVENVNYMKQDPIITLSIYDDGHDYFYISATNEGAELSKNVSIQNANSDGTEVYGSRIRARINVSNSGDGTYRHLLETALVNNKTEAVEFKTMKTIDVEGNETKYFDIDIPVAKKYIGGEYRLVATHYEGDNRVETITMPFEVLRGINYWTAEGKMKGVPFSENFTVPEDALALEMRQGTFTSVKPNSNPNTIYMLDKKLPSGLEGYNLTNSDNTAPRIHLYDGYDYYIPENITVQQEVTYERTYSPQTEGRWQTIALPFEPEEVLLAENETPLRIAATFTDIDGECFLAVPNRITEAGTVSLFSSNGFVINMPILMALLPQYDGKTIVFRTKNIKLLAGQPIEHVRNGSGVVSMYGTNSTVMPENVWTLETNGTMIYRQADAEVKAFRAYMKVNNGTMPSDGYAVEIAFPDIIATGISEIGSDANGSQSAVNDGNHVGIYTIDGRKVADGQMKKGIYIVNGKKVVVK